MRSEEKNIVIDGVEIHYEVSGPETYDGPSVVLMHGWGCDHTTVKSIANAINPFMRVYNVDLPGHGSSSEPPSVWGVEAFTHTMEKFIKELDIRNPIPVGHSFGGRISILMASRNPIEKMVLIDAAGIKPKRKPKYYFKVYSFKILKKILPLLLGNKKGNNVVDKLRNSTGSADYRNSSATMKAVMSKCVNEDLKSVMPSIKASTLLIWGENDTATPLKDAKTMQKLIPDAGLVSWPDCGHYSFLDNPVTFRAVIQTFLKPKTI